ALAQLIGSGQQSSRGDYELEKDFVIPYEWALPPDFPNDETGRSMDCKYNSVCVLWIKDNLLRGKLASFLADLQGRLEEFLRKAGNENFCKDLEAINPVARAINAKQAAQKTPAPPSAPARHSFEAPAADFAIAGGINSNDLLTLLQEYRSLASAAKQQS